MERLITLGQLRDMINLVIENKPELADRYVLFPEGIYGNNYVSIYEDDPLDDEGCVIISCW